MVSFKNTVSEDVNIPQFWVSSVSYGGQSAAIFYGDTKAQAQAKGDAYISSQTKGSKQQIGGENGGGSVVPTYQSLEDVMLAYNSCELTFRQASIEMKKINPSLSDNDIQDMLVHDNPTPPDCDGDGKPAGQDDDGDTPPADDWDFWPLSDENRYMLLGVLVVYLLWRYGRD